MEESILRFVARFLEMNRIPIQRVRLPLEEYVPVDLGLRQILSRPDRFLPNLERFLATCQPRAVYFLSDQFQCGYVVMRLSETELLLCGPVLFEQMSPARFAEIVEKLRIPPELHEQLRDYYRQISTALSQHAFTTLISCLAERIYGAGKFQLIFSDAHGLSQWDQLDAGSFHAADPPLLSMQLAETRYRLADELLAAVSQGNQPQASALIIKLISLSAPLHFLDELRDIKDNLLGVNTLLRLAAKYAGVHPLRIDALYTRCIRQCEELASVDQGQRLALRLVRDYCQMVRQHTLRSYSPLIQKVVYLIDLDITADLRLKSIAAQVNVNASHLSALFKREVGVSLTDYVNHKRIEHAKFLLQSTSLQMKRIVERIGITDVYYFSRLFKKITGLSPREYRQKYRNLNRYPGTY